MPTLRDYTAARDALRLAGDGATPGEARAFLKLVREGDARGNWFSCVPPLNDEGEAAGRPGAACRLCVPRM